ncbi:MAG: ABC transporter permease [Chthoniobacteraceae bacterium]|nr:ABC transporter permease [Chthoniobacteraceae bacterium]
MQNETADFEVTLRPATGWLQIELAGIWHYRDLLFLLVWRDFVSKYKQTILGPLWFIVQPLLNTVVFTVIFSNVAKLSTDGLPPLLFYLCGQLGWNYFAQNFGACSATLVNNAGLFGKVYFPRLVVPLSNAVSNLLTFAIQAATFTVFYLFYKYGMRLESFGVTWQAVFLPLLVLQSAVLSLGLGLIMSALTAKFRDLVHLTPLLIQLWMYASAVIIPLSQFPEKWRWVVALNPMISIVESFRLILLGTGTVEPLYLAFSVVFTLLALAAGLLLFGKVEKTFVDTV